MKKLILTGFEPFGSYEFNPTQDIVKEFDGTDNLGVKISGIVLPCAYYKASEILFDKINELEADIVLSCGLSSGIKRIRIEAVGRNIMNGKYPDCEGKNPRNEKISYTGNLSYFTNTNSVMLANRLHEKGIDAEVSVDAEEYVCNSLIYNVLMRIQDNNLPIKFAFFHTPWTNDYLHKIELEQSKVTIDKIDLRKTIEVLISELVKE